MSVRRWVYQKTCIEKTFIQNKEAVNGPIFKIIFVCNLKGSIKPAVLMFQGNNTFIIWNTNVKPDGGFSEICGAAERLDSETPGEFFVCSKPLSASSFNL